MSLFLLLFSVYHKLSSMVSMLHVAEVIQDASLRKSFSVKEKREYVLAIDDLIARGSSRRQACAMVNLPHNYYPRFKKVMKKIDDLDNAGFVPFKTNGTARKIHPGRPSLLQEIREDLSRFVFEIRQRGLQVSTRMIRQEACRLLPSFRSKSMHARKRIVTRFTKKMGLTHRAATHTAQKNFNETEEESRHFLEMMKEKLADYDPSDVINMDQSPIPYSYNSSKTLEVKGKKTIHVRSSTADTKRVTLAVTIDASGKMLPPMLIFKGATNGRIATREFGTFPDGGHYCCQKKAWMDEKMMQKWIDLVLVPWKETTTPGVVPLLILDAYRVHMMGTVVNRIQSLGIEVIHIPPGCTYLCQPVDIGINKVIKCGMREKWEDWMLEGEGIVDGVAKEPTRKLVAEWLVSVYTNMSGQTVRNAWMKKGYEWF
jgi:hypothetical protein